MLSRRVRWSGPETPKARPAKVRVDPLERAKAWAALIDGESIRTRADLARHLRVSRARVTQVLKVLERAEAVAAK